MRKKSLWTVLALVVVVGAATILWLTHRPTGGTGHAATANGGMSPTAAAGASPPGRTAPATPTPGPAPATPTAIPGLSVSKVTAAWVARWKTPPTAIPHPRPDSDQVLMRAGYPGDAGSQLILAITRSPQAPDTVWGVSCGNGRSDGRPTSAKPLPDLADYCLKGALRKAEYDQVLAWLKSAPRPRAEVVRRQFAGFTGAIRGFPDGGVSLYLNGGTFTV